MLVMVKVDLLTSMLGIGSKRTGCPEKWRSSSVGVTDPRAFGENGLKLVGFPRSGKGSRSWSVDTGMEELGLIQRVQSRIQL